MDSLYGNDRKLSDFDDSGVTSYFLLDQEDVFQTSSMFQELTSDGKDQQRSLPNERTSSPELFSWCPEIKLSTDQYADHDWFNSLLEDPVLNDKMITDAVQSPRITSEHSYSINNDQSLNSSIGALCKVDDFGKDIDVDIFDSNHGALDLSQKTYNPAQIIVKQEPVENETENVVCSNSSTNNVDSNITVQNVVNTGSPNICSSSISSSSISSTMTPIASNSQPTIIFSTTPTKCQIKAEPQILSTISIKSEPEEFMDASSDHSGFECITLPPTPPSSNNSDSEGSLSPQRSAPSSPVRPVSVTKPIQSSNNKHITQPLFTNPIPQSGYLMLSEEEKRTLVAEGYPIPGKLPLTKQEEKNLKKIRRKIKNKISAQESRRKKKEYLEALEKRVETFTQENVDLRKRVDSLETNNRSLLGQLEKLQVLCGKMPRPSSASSTQTGTVLMVVVLSFAVFLGSWAPTSLNIGYSSPSSNADPIFYSNPRPLHPSPAMGPQLQNVRVDDYNTPSIKSRVLLSAKEDLEDLFGPDIPMKSKTEVPEFNNNTLLKMNGSFMGKLPISWALSSFGSTLSDTKFDELNSTATTKVSVAVNGHFYNESSSMAVNLKATMHPHVVSAPSSDIVSFEKFGNATTEIESQ